MARTREGPALIPGRPLRMSALRVSLAATLLLAASCSKEPVPQAWAKQNLVLITMDTTRADHLGCYGDAAAATPILDTLAR